MSIAMIRHAFRVADEFTRAGQEIARAFRVPLSVIYPDEWSAPQRLGD